MKSKLKINDINGEIDASRIDEMRIDVCIDFINICCFFDNRLYYDRNENGYGLFFLKQGGYILENATAKECYMFLQGIRYYHNNGSIAHKQI